MEGATTRFIHELCDNETVLCSESLFYELMTTNPKSQLKCFSKLPTNPRAFRLMPDIGVLLRAELESRSSCGALEQYVIPGAYIFNEKLRNGTYIAEGEVLNTLNDWQKQVGQEAKDFLIMCQSVYQFFPQLIGIEFRDFPAALAAARSRVATDAEEVKRIYTSFDRIDLPANAPLPEELTPSWAWFRWVQCQLLATLRIFARYQCKVPSNPSPAILERAEHSMHDLRYVLLGVLAGAIASNDDEIIEDFRLACPNGKVITTRPK
ncbi:MAG: hypothetical protein ACYCY5_03140 [Sulfuricella sp.]